MLSSDDALERGPASPMCKGVLVSVGILGGTGALGRGLALRLADSGVPVVIGSRDGDRAASVVAELLGAWPGRSLAVAGAGNEAAAACDVVFLATPWDAALPTARSLAGELGEKVVVCVANALVKQGREMHALIPARGSIAAAVQAVVPRAKVAAACQHLPASTLANLDAALDVDVLVCADDAVATAVTSELLSKVAGLRPLDAGSLASAGAIEAFTAVLVTLNMRYKAHASLRLSGIDTSP